MHRSWMPAILVVLVSTGCAQELAEKRSDILMGPYVNYVSESSAKVLWVTAGDVPAGCNLLIEPAYKGIETKAESRITSIAGRPELLHTTVLSGLRSGQGHRCFVLCREDLVENHFFTAPPAGSQ